MIASKGSLSQEGSSDSVSRNAIKASPASARRFLEVLQQEMARSDRNTHSLKLVTFKLTPRERQARLQSCIDGLQSAMRKTDQMGWIARNRLGVLLSDAGENGGDRFIERAREKLDKSGLRPAVGMHHYPREGLHSDSTSRRDAKDSSDGVQHMEQQVLFSTDKTHALTSSTADSTKADAPRGEVSDPVEVSPLEEVLPAPISPIKRASDICGSLLALLVLSPIMLGIALLIKCVSPGPVFFTQERIGHMGRRFRCFKFRTMHVNTSTDEHKAYLSKLIKSPQPMTKLDDMDDPRVIPFGLLLRKSGLDELPQLCNVLIGDMSLVGPRPCIPYEYKEFDRWQRRRTHAMPGLTGLWQVSGKNKTTFEQMIRYDIAYGREQSPALDASIMLKTLPAIVEQIRPSDGGSAEGDSDDRKLVRVV